MSERDLTIKDRLEDILESIGLIEEWSQGRRNGVRHHCACT